MAENGSPRQRGNESSHELEKPKSTFAFVFDIDGVVLDNKQPLPGASDTIKLLLQRKIPFAFLTNGGGLPESKAIQLLAKILSIPGRLSECQLVQSHTPFKELVDEFRDKTVLVIGSSTTVTRKVAEQYGFKRVITTADMAKTFPGKTRASVYLTSIGRAEVDFSGKHIEQLSNKTVQISAILVFQGPGSTRDLDAHIVTDLLLSENGIYPSKSMLNGNILIPNWGYLQDSQPKIYFGNMHEDWITATIQTNSTQLAFRKTVKGVWDMQTKGADLNPAIVRYGKPSEIAFVWGEKALHEYHGSLQPGKTPPHIKTTYMVGDYPNTDVLGAKNYTSRYDSEWKSILVESGLYKKGAVPEHKPDHIVPSVKDAVELALKLEGDHESLALMAELTH